MLVGGAEQPGRPVHGRQRAVVVGAEALQQPLDLEAVARELPLAHALGHRDALPNHRRGVPLRPDAAIEPAAAEVLGAVAAVAGRQEREHAVQRGVERGGIAAPRVGEADECGDLRRTVVEPAGLRHREPQQRVGSGDLASGVGHPIDPETGADRPAVDPCADNTTTAAAISSWTLNTSLKSRSYVSDHRCTPSFARISCAVTRIVRPGLADATLKQMGHVQRVGDFRDRHLLALEIGR